MTEKPKTILLQSIEYIPLVIAIIITIGFLKLAIYYSVFNLSVFPYVEATDFISEGLSNFGLFGISLLIGFSSPLKMTPIKIEVEDGIKNYDSIQHNAKRYLKMIKLFIYALILIIIVASIFQLCKYHSFDTKSQRMLASATFGILMLFLSINVADSYLERTLYTHYDRNIFGIAIMASIFAIVIVWVRYAEGLDVKYDHTFIGTTIEIGNKKLISDKNYYYIGETKSYLFFHNELKNTNDVFQKTQIQRIERVN